MAKRRRSRIYWRIRGGAQRAYGDFRDFRDVGGGREALVAKGEKLATSDPDVADRLAAERVAQLDAFRRARSIHGLQPPRDSGGDTLAGAGAKHLVRKKRSGKVTDKHLSELEHRLRDAIAFLGADTPLDAIDATDVERWLDSLADRGLAPASVRHYANALNGLYARAVRDKLARLNPVAAVDKPSPSIGLVEAWLEVPEAALLLECARAVEREEERDRERREAGERVPANEEAPRIEIPVYAILATFLLTGGRFSEVMGLEIADVRFDRETVTFRPNRWRRLKTKRSARVVPLHPQLRAILRDHLFQRPDPDAELLFPSPRGGGMIRDVRKAIDRVAMLAGWAPGEISTRMLRRSFVSARLQTLDRGAPISPWTVAREVGHSTTRMIEEVYGRLGNVRHRAEVVEFEVEQHVDVLGERLAALRVVGAS